MSIQDGHRRSYRVPENPIRCLASTPVIFESSLPVKLTEVNSTLDRVSGMTRSGITRMSNGRRAVNSSPWFHHPDRPCERPAVPVTSSRRHRLSTCQGTETAQIGGKPPKIPEPHPLSTGVGMQSVRFLVLRSKHWGAIGTSIGLCDGQHSYRNSQSP